MDTTFTDDSVSTDAIELRVLHGPQAGSTLPLEHGQTYTLGTADTCAVLLAGTQVEQEHVTLAADGDGIQVMPMQGRVMTLDRGEVASGQMLPLGTVLRLGRVKVTVDSVDAPWPQDDVLEESEPVVAPQADPELADEPQAEAAPAATATVQAASRAKRTGNLLPSLLLGTAAMLLMGAAVAAWVTNEAEVQPAADGVAQQASPPAAAASASASAKAPERRVMTETERLAVVTQFLEKRRVAGEMELNVQKTGAGTLRIVGAAASEPGLSALIDASRTELADAAPVEFAVMLRPELVARFEDRLRSSGLAPKFKVTRRDPKLELQAVLTATEVRTWEKLFEDFAREYGSVLTVVAQVQHERDTIESQIETVVAGAFPYVVTTGGRRIAPGGALEGRTLTAIRDGELVFSDGLRVRYSN